MLAVVWLGLGDSFHQVHKKDLFGQPRPCRPPSLQLPSQLPPRRPQLNVKHYRCSSRRCYIVGHSSKKSTVAVWHSTGSFDFRSRQSVTWLTDVIIYEFPMDWFDSSSIGLNSHTVFHTNVSSFTYSCPSCRTSSLLLTELLASSVILELQ